MQLSRVTCITANLVGMMLFVQVILGGTAFILDTPVIYHLIWGILTLVVLILATVLASRAYGTGTNLFKVGLVAILDLVLQGIIGLLSFNAGVPLVIHLTNAFVLAILVTYLISFADTADKTATHLPSAGQTMSSGKLPS